MAFVPIKENLIPEVANSGKLEKAVIMEYGVSSEEVGSEQYTVVEEKIEKV